VSRDADTAGEEQLVSCAAEQSKYCSIFTVTLSPCGDLPFTSWGRWQCLRGGADNLNGCYAACGCGTEYRCGPCWGEACGDMLEAMARIALSQPNDAMARIASRRNRTISLDPNLPGQNSERGSLDVDSKLLSKVQIDSKVYWARIRGRIRPPPRSQSPEPTYLRAA
jgi:hypothetical protein